jgi:elongation factor P hydroxylase
MSSSLQMIFAYLLFKNDYNYKIVKGNDTIIYNKLLYTNTR